MTETAPIPPTFTDVDHVATGGGDSPEVIVTPTELQRYALEALAELLSLGLPRCSWTMHAPHPDHVVLYTSGRRPTLTGIPTSASEVAAWAAHFGVEPHPHPDSLVHAQFPVGALTVEIFAKHRDAGNADGAARPGGGGRLWVS